MPLKGAKEEIKILFKVLVLATLTNHLQGPHTSNANFNQCFVTKRKKNNQNPMSKAKLWPFHICDLGIRQGGIPPWIFPDRDQRYAK